MVQRFISITGEELSYRMASVSYWINHDRRSSNLSVLVNGSPKTGTTWMLNLVASVPGFQIANGYNFQGEIHRYNDVSPGDVIHGHDPFTGELWGILTARNIKVIHMMRDPRDQTVSRMFHIRRDPTHTWHHRFQEMSDEQSLMACIEGRESSLPGTVDMINFTKSWLNEGEKSHCVRYESLKSSPVDELLKVFGYLELQVNKSLIHAIIERNRFERSSVGKKFWKGPRKPGQEDASSHARKGIIGDWKNYFTQAHCQRYKELAGESLIELGYEQDLDW